MKYLHTMVRVADLEKSLHFYCGLLGLQETIRKESKAGRFTLVYLSAPDDLNDDLDAPLIELTYNWDSENYTEGRNFGHLAFEVENIYSLCEKIQKTGVVINRPPRDGYMAFVRSPDGISIEFLQKGGALTPQEPWKSMPSTGHW